MNIDNVMDLESEFEKAKSGREIWLLLSEKYNIDSDCGLIFFPVDDYELNMKAISLLPTYINPHLRKLYVLTDQKSVTETIKGLSCQEIVGIDLSQTEMDDLLKYYRLAAFSGHIVIVSLEEPFGNDHLLKKKDISLKDFILSSIFKVR